MSGIESKWSSFSELRFDEQPTLLKPSCGYYCCIFRAPRNLVQINEKAYEPQIVSIGPYHHGRQRLIMVEQHKPRFLSTLLERTKDSGVGLDGYFNFVALREKKIRDCYSEHLIYESSALVEMMVLDACFIVEVFRIFGGVIQPHPDDPLLGMPWIFNILVRDLLGIENQIPWFVLQEVFDLSEGNTAEEDAKVSLSELALGFFNIAAKRPQEELKLYGITNFPHLLGLFRQSLIGHWKPKESGYDNVDYVRLIPSATQLRRSTVKIQPSLGNKPYFVDIQFNDGVLQMPPLTLDDFTSTFLLNCIAFEQCFIYCSGHITSYITFMGCLVRTERDAELLSENRILMNYLGSNAEVATFFNDLSKAAALDIRESYLAGLFGQVNEYHPGKWHVLRTEIETKYFSSPWSAISAVAAFFLLVLTIVQAFYAVFTYHHPPR